MVKIFRLLGKKTNSVLLEYFLDHNSREYHPAILLKKIKISKMSLYKGLRELEKSGILNKKSLGKMNMYDLDNENPLVKQLKKLHILGKVAEQAVSLKDQAEVYLYGSCARGENIEESDIDILVVTNIERREITKHLKNEKTKIMIFTPLEYSMLYKQDKPFYERVERDKIRVI